MKLNVIFFLLLKFILYYRRRHDLLIYIKTGNKMLGESPGNNKNKYSDYTLWCLVYTE